MAITKIPSIALSAEVAANLSGLKVTSISYASGSGAANSGGDTITLTGANFDANLEIYINSELVSNINVANSTSVSFTSPDVPIGVYVIYVVNPDGKTAIVAPGLNAIEGYTFQGTVSGYSSGGQRGGFTRNTIDKFPFASDSNATDVGDLTRTVRRALGGNSSNESGYTAGGGSYSASGLTNIIDKFPFSSDANATDVGDLTQAKGDIAAQSSSVSGYVSGGNAAPPFLNVIEKFPFSSDSNSADVGDLTQARSGSAGQSSSDNGYTSGGSDSGSPSFLNTIDKFPFATDANATDVGDLTQSRSIAAGQSSEENGYTSGGAVGPSESNVIDKFPFASDANATDVGDLTSILSGRNAVSGQSSTVSGYSSGGGLGPTQYDIIDKFSFASGGNATDVGNVTQGGYGFAGHQV